MNLNLPMSYRARAPGSMMLFGEHAVLRGSLAMVMALDSYLSVFFHFREDKKVIVEALGTIYETQLDEYEALANLKYVQRCLETIAKIKTPFSDRLAKGFDIRIESDIGSTMGFGSSAALVAALLRVLQLAYGWEASMDLLKLGLEVIHQVQKRGSGADLAASLYGGVIVYSLEKGVIESLESWNEEMELIYSGSKVPTAEILDQLAQLEKKGQLDVQAIEEMGIVAELAVEAWKLKDLKRIRELSLRHGSCMKRLHLYNEALERIESNLLKAGIACKISGSGLGDCMLAWGHDEKQMLYRRFKIKVAQKGSLSS